MLLKALRLCYTNDSHARYIELGMSSARSQSFAFVKSKCFSGNAYVTKIFKHCKSDVETQAENWVKGYMLDYLFKKDITIDAWKWVEYNFVAFRNHGCDLDNSHIIVHKTIFSTLDITIWISSKVFFDSMDDIPKHRGVDQYDVLYVSPLTIKISILSN